MKRFTKFCLILAAALGVIGIAGICLGMAMGARPGQFLNLAHYENSIFRRLERHTDRLDDNLDQLDEAVEGWSDNLEEDIEAWTEKIEENADDWGGYQGGDHRNGEHHDWGSLSEIGQLQAPTGDNLDTFEDSFPSDSVEKLDLELNFAVLHIYEDEEGSDIRISGCNGLDYFKSRLDGDTLKLEDTRTHSQYQRDQALELNVWLPVRNFEKIELDLGASDVSIESLQAEKIQIDAGAGLLDVERMEGAETVLDIGMGSCTVAELLVSRSADLDVGAGELNVEYVSGNRVKLDCGMGSAMMTLSGRETDYNYELNCGVGMLQLGSRSYSGLDRSQTIDNGAEKTINADCGIGTILLDFEKN